MENCKSFRNRSVGFLLVQPNVVMSNCIAEGNLEKGIYGGWRIKISKCAMNGNGNNGQYDAGIYLGGFYNTIKDCTASGNNGTGIVCHAMTVLENNLCSDNKVIGIRVGFVQLDNYGCRIEGNHLVNNNIGMWMHNPQVGHRGNLIIRNTFSGNSTTYSIPSTHTYGPFIDATSGGELSTANPNANIMF